MPVFQNCEEDQLFHLITKRKKRYKKLIKEHGGKVAKSGDEFGAITLTSYKHRHQRRETFQLKYIKDCIKKNKILDYYKYSWRLWPSDEHTFCSLMNQESCHDCLFNRHTRSKESENSVEADKLTQVPARNSSEASTSKLNEYREETIEHSEKDSSKNKTSNNAIANLNKKCFLNIAIERVVNFDKSSKQSTRQENGNIQSKIKEYKIRPLSIVCEKLKIPPKIDSSSSSMNSTDPINKSRESKSTLPNVKNNSKNVPLRLTRDFDRSENSSMEPDSKRRKIDNSAEKRTLIDRIAVNEMISESIEDLKSAKNVQKLCRNYELFMNSQVPETREKIYSQTIVNNSDDLFDSVPSDESQFRIESQDFDSLQVFPSSTPQWIDSSVNDSLTQENVNFIGKNSEQPSSISQNTNKKSVAISAKKDDFHEQSEKSGNRDSALNFGKNRQISRVNSKNDFSASRVNSEENRENSSEDREIEFSSSSANSGENREISRVNSKNNFSASSVNIVENRENSSEDREIEFSSSSTNFGENREISRANRENEFSSPSANCPENPENGFSDLNSNSGEGAKNSGKIRETKFLSPSISNFGNGPEILEEEFSEINTMPGEKSVPEKDSLLDSEDRDALMSDDSETDFENSVREETMCVSQSNESVVEVDVEGKKKEIEVILIDDDDDDDYICEENVIIREKVEKIDEVIPTTQINRKSSGNEENHQNNQISEISGSDPKQGIFEILKQSQHYFLGNEDQQDQRIDSRFDEGKSISPIEKQSQRFPSEINGDVDDSGETIIFEPVVRKISSDQGKLQENPKKIEKIKHLYTPTDYWDGWNSSDEAD